MSTHRLWLRYPPPTQKSLPHRRQSTAWPDKSPAAFTTLHTRPNRGRLIIAIPPESMGNAAMCRFRARPAGAGLGSVVHPNKLDI